MTDNSNPNEGRILIPSDGLYLAADLTLAGRSAPLIVLVHGFAGDKDEKGLFTSARDFFVGSGFSVLRFDHRGCGESAGKFIDTRLDHLRRDLLNVIRFIRRTEEPTSLGLIGFSLGAATSILANSKHVETYVFWSPAIDTGRDMFPRYQTTQIAAELQAKRSFCKSGLEVSEAFLQDLKRNRVLFKARKLKPPILLIHGSADERISPASSSRSIALFSKSSRYCLVPGADHSFRAKPNDREFLFSNTLEWFKKFLLVSREPLLKGKSPICGQARAAHA